MTQSPVCVATLQPVFDSPPPCLLSFPAHHHHHACCLAVSHRVRAFRYCTATQQRGNMSLFLPGCTRHGSSPSVPRRPPPPSSVSPNRCCCAPAVLLLSFSLSVLPFLTRYGLFCRLPVLPAAVGSPASCGVLLRSGLPRLRPAPLPTPSPKPPLPFLFFKSPLLFLPCDMLAAARVYIYGSLPSCTHTR